MYKIILNANKPKNNYIPIIYRLIYKPDGYNERCTYFYHCDEETVKAIYAYCTHRKIFSLIHLNWTTSECGIKCNKDCKFAEYIKPFRITWIHYTERDVYVNNYLSRKDNKNTIWEKGTKPEGHQIVNAFFNGIWSRMLYIYVKVFSLPWKQC